MKHKEYWERRFEALEEAQMQKGTEYYARLEKQYRRAMRAVQKDIETWYARLAVNNELTMQGARKLLTADELDEFHWNVMEYIEKGRTLNISDQWAKQLENASAKFHISRLEAIKLQMQNHVEVLYGTEHDEFSSLMENIYTEGYYHTAYEIQKGFGIGYDLMRLDKNKVEKVLSKPWAADGSNFSSRIWQQKAQLVNELETHLTQAIIQGRNPSVVTDIIAKRFEVSKGRAGRLVMTEAAFFNSASNRDCYKELDVEQYEILATLDRKTSDICQELDGKVFKMSEYAVGVTAPPFHTWCRTTTVPFFDDEFELGSKRAARGDDGKTYHVPADMKYDDWKKTFVDGGSKENLQRMSAKDMASNGNVIDWGEKGTKISNEQYKDIMKYARERNIEMSGFKNYDGKPENLTVLIDDVSEVAKLYPGITDGKKRLTITLDTIMDSVDFAKTNGHIISINANAFRNIEKLQEEYQKLVAEGWFVKGTDFHSVIKHEIGHVIANKYNIDGLALAGEITGLKNAELMEYLSENLSEYSASYEDGREIISECFSSVYGNGEKSEFALKFVEKCGIIVEKD